jgi:type I restriction enzyme M protein
MARGKAKDSTTGANLGFVAPYKGRVYDPCNGSAGMFLQSARLGQEHQKNLGAELSVHGLAGDIRQGNAYYEDLRGSAGEFDFVMATPPQGNNTTQPWSPN